MDEQQKLREQAWAVMKHMHDNPGEPLIQAAGGWCAPSEVTYFFGTQAEFDAMPPRFLTEFDAIMGVTR